MLRWLILYPKNIFRFIRPVHVHLKTDKVDLKKKQPRKKKFCIFFQSPHQVDTKNVVECPREFFAYFNALETYSPDICILCLDWRGRFWKRLSNSVSAYIKRLPIISIAIFLIIPVKCKNINRKYFWNYYLFLFLNTN